MINITENGKIDWAMFGMAVKNFRRGKKLNTDQFAEAINRTDGGEKPIINGSQVERIESGKLIPTFEQLAVLARMSSNPTILINMVSTIANGLMSEPDGADVARPVAQPTAQVQ